MRPIGVLGATALAAALAVGVPAHPLAADLVETARQDGRFETLVEALEAAGLVDRLGGEAGPFTVFAPTDRAFEALPVDELRARLAGERERLQILLLQHVVEGRLPSTALPRRLEPLAGGALAIEFSGGTLSVAGADQQLATRPAMVVAGDIQADNGVIHAIDTVLVPLILTTPPRQADARPAWDDGEAAEPGIAIGPPDQAAGVEIAAAPEDAEAIEPRITAHSEPPEPPPAAAAPPAGGEVEDAPEPEVAVAEPTAAPTEIEPEPEPEAPIEVVSVTRGLLGRTVRSSDGETEGQIADLILARDSGQIELVIVATGGFLGFWQREVAVPWREVTFDGGTGEVVVDRTGAELDEAPEFTYDALDTERYAWAGP